MPIYSKNNTGTLSNDLYFDVFQRKGVKFLKIVRSTKFDKLVGQEFDVQDEHIWSKGDSLQKLSNRYFGEYKYWWVIGVINSKPTDAHFQIGDRVYIPSNPYHMAELMK